jgi:riboflavin biosynthesis pyrimidine reductase
MTKQIFQLYPSQTEGLPLEGMYLESRLHQLGSSETPFVYGNFISSLDGRIALMDTAGATGYLPDELGNPDDFRLFLELEAQADCLITHGGYLRAIAAGRLDDILQVGTTKETRDLAAWRRTQGLSEQPAVVIASASLDFVVPESVERHRQKVYIATGNEADPVRVRHFERKGYEIIRAGHDRMVEGGPLVRAVGRLGYKSLYLLTGPRMLQTMLHDRVLSRLYVTIVHHVIGGEAFHTLTLGPQLRQAGRLHLRSLYHDPASESHAGQWFAQFEPAVPRDP